MFLSWWRSLVNVANPNIDNSKGVGAGGYPGSSAPP